MVSDFEGEIVEFVDGMEHLDEAIRAMSAMLNRYNNARIFIGVDGLGHAIGADLSSEDIDTVRTRVSELLNRMPVMNITLEFEGGKDYIRIIAEGYETPYAWKGWFYTRKCNPTRPQGSDGPVVNEWVETLTCGMKRH